MARRYDYFPGFIRFFVLDAAIFGSAFVPSTMENTDVVSVMDLIFGI
ncbi:hypothetical protein PL8927_270279 [Planktothrix serta PCC 8927]|uniref:Uncharacterized protein n=1 Tax=Planktothrix serta PCC 8927 TaxID=671068 RepID=A0A7Z9BKG3_9CYAN|nr:hypothetical protein PL8927_270279 [Planktothrix serta PCC 8927]